MSRSKKNQQNDTSNSVLSIEELAKQSDKLADTQIEVLQERILQLENTIKSKNQEIALLKEQIDNTEERYEPTSYLPTQEELIALKQLDLLQQDSLSRRLTLEEIKIFDILVKNKRLAQGESTGTVDMVKLPKDKATLIQIAARPVKHEEE